MGEGGDQEGQQDLAGGGGGLGGLAGSWRQSPGGLGLRELAMLGGGEKTWQIQSLFTPTSPPTIPASLYLANCSWCQCSLMPGAQLEGKGAGKGSRSGWLAGLQWRDQKAKTSPLSGGAESYSNLLQLGLGLFCWFWGVSWSAGRAVHLGGGGRGRRGKNSPVVEGLGRV